MSVLAIENVSKSFGGIRVTRDVSLVVQQGERHLILGPNGAGKTTLFNQITGDVLPDSGRIRLLGHDITHLPPQSRTHLGMSRTYQIITLFGADSIRHNVTLAALGLTARRWNPFIADEPFAGLSADERQGIKSLLMGLPRDITMVMIEHDMDVALDFAERITVLNFGEVVSQGPKAQVIADPRTQEVYLGS
jgi:branched-chain amino acid transport system ATP-binding protein